MQNFRRQSNELVLQYFYDFFCVVDPDPVDP